MVIEQLVKTPVTVYATWRPARVAIFQSKLSRRQAVDPTETMRHQDPTTGRFAILHGKSRSIEYPSWHSMMHRCYNPKRNSFKNYGGRGILVCQRWHDLKNFIADMGERPSAKYSLDRIDNDKGYEPGNCRWAIRKEQARNTTRSKLDLAKAREIRMLYQRGYTQKELAKEFGIGQAMVSCVVRGEQWKE